MIPRFCLHMTYHWASLGVEGFSQCAALALALLPHLLVAVHNRRQDQSAVAALLGQPFARDSSLLP